MKREAGRVTIKTVAAALGVSICTVNKALTGKPRVSEETRRRVQKAAAKLGYRPNRLARSLVRRVLNIGVISPDVWPSHMELLTDGVRARLSDLRDHRVLGEFIRVPGLADGAAYEKALRRLMGSQVSGLVVTPGSFTEVEDRRIRELLVGSGIPFVLLGIPDWKDAGLCLVSHDCPLCGRMAAELLCAMTPAGPLAMVLGDKTVPDHRLKMEGFSLEATAQSRMLADVAEAQDDPRKAYPATGALLDRHPRISGIYIATENCDGVCRCLLDRGLAGKIRVVATGNSAAVGHYMEEGVIHASIFQNQFLQGRRAVDMLFQWLETGETPTREVLVPPVVMLKSNAAQFPAARG